MLKMKVKKKIIEKHYKAKCAVATRECKMGREQNKKVYL